MDLQEALRAAAEALLIGLLVGAEREASREEEERQPGVRDFVLIALVGAICGLLANPWLTIAALVATAGLLAVFHLRTPRSGITTELAGVATFCLGFLTAVPGISFGPTLAVGLTVVIAILLEAKRSIHKFIREMITETELNDTLRFLAIIFVIYPVLPDRQYGPYGFFDPHQVWLFVILVSSVSYAGYFLEKFLGARIGLRLAGLLGGLASSTAATASLARAAADHPPVAALYAQAAVAANAVQFPRVLAILTAVSPATARAAAVPLLVMTTAGLAVALVMNRRGKPDTVAPEFRLHNPFRLLPALKFGVVFSAVLLLSKAVGLALGGGAVLGTSAAGGSISADAAVLSVSELLTHGTISSGTAQAAVLVALLANAVVKTAIAAHAGAAAFTRKLAAAFAVMFAAGGITWLVMSRL